MEELARVTHAADMGLTLLEQTRPTIIQFILTDDDWNFASPAGDPSEALQDTLVQTLLQMSANDSNLKPELGFAISEVFERASQIGYRCISNRATILGDNLSTPVLVKALVL